MRRSIAYVSFVFAAPLFAAVAAIPACSGTGGVIVGTGGTNGTTGTHGASGTTVGGGHSTSTTSTSTSTSTSSGTGNTTAPTSSTSSGTPCSNLQCNVQQCANGGHTTISGTILDPAGANPLYNVVAYIPNSDVQPLPNGATCNSCNSLFSGDPMADGLSDDKGHFVITDAPVSANVPVVIQVGKWRTHTTVSNVVACQDNPIGSVKFPSKMDSSDGIINLPDIAVSTGSADSLECLLARIGIDPSEYTPGAGGGKVHIFNGGNASPPGMGVGGAPEQNPMPGAPNSDQALWNSASSLAPYDIVLLSCEGDETYDAMPANLEAYLNTGGGRVFASHFHYSWFTGGTEGQTPAYSSPTDWGTGGSNLASWSTGTGTGTGNSTNGDVIQTLWNGNAFPKGQALYAWLGNVGALSGSSLNIVQPRENSTVSMTNVGSQPWITDPGTNSTLYFSFNTPWNLSALQEGTTCQGRAVFSGLHVGGASYDSVNCQSGYGGFGCPSGAPSPAPPPAGCDTSHGLSPQEKALEFMLFDLSSCVVPDTANPADAGSGPHWQ